MVRYGLISFVLFCFYVSCTDAMGALLGITFVPFFFLLKEPEKCWNMGREPPIAQEDMLRSSPGIPNQKPSEG